MKPFPRFTPAAATSATGDAHDAHDPYLGHRPRKHGWSQLPARVHLRRGYRLKGRITPGALPRERGAK